MQDGLILYKNWIFLNLDSSFCELPMTVINQFHNKYQRRSNTFLLISIGKAWRWRLEILFVLVLIANWIKWKICNHLDYYNNYQFLLKFGPTPQLTWSKDFPLLAAKMYLWWSWTVFQICLLYMNLTPSYCYHISSTLLWSHFPLT